ncbi:hypothetical protein BDV93DRAFT_609633 [Ceratobasidium sp. AG-I]|nr:hypothetical protein BDV93DRAFT_609633 [Ceratobasidium sp. AG-I]
MSNAYRVADIPELVCSVATFLSDPRPLLLVSRHFFCSVAPFIWRSVPRVDVLLRLIPGTTERRTLFSDSWETHSLLFDITLPNSLDLTRFDTYAPWVQRLEVFGGNKKHKLHNAEALFHLASTRPILPNLRALTLTMRDEVATDECLSFIELFLSPTLTEIRHVRKRYPPYLDIYWVPDFVEKVLRICPGIKILEFYPDKVPGSGEPLKETDILAFLDAKIRATMAGFSNLRSFTSTFYIFEPAMLQVLGNLPLLESLDVTNGAAHHASFKGGLVVPDTWFSSLRHLHLRHFDAPVVSALWRHPLARNLESATIQCNPASASGTFCTATRQAWVDIFLTALPQASPHISKLDLDFQSLSLSPPVYSITHTGIEALRQLPLRNIRLRCLWTRYEDLAQALPGVEEFCSMDAQVDLGQLYVFATHMPRLRSLTIDIRWVIPPGSDKAPCAALGSRPPIVLISPFKLAELNIPLAQLKEMARFLAKVWPGGLHGEAYLSTWQVRDEVKNEILDQLNEAICEYMAKAAVSMPRARSASR